MVYYDMKNNYEQTIGVFETNNGYTYRVPGPTPENYYTPGTFWKTPEEALNAYNTIIEECHIEAPKNQLHVVNRPKTVQAKHYRYLQLCYEIEQKKKELEKIIPQKLREANRKLPIQGLKQRKINNL